ncbi:non-homologous end-joining DNA ligase [Nocardioides alcanivorans]|uniref:non-homologous end-joining DNA ligase n=1 Tax=Nocardioides alcanivorans TaxID=2897352 RepID=UPI001F473CAE|nr:non-homologous end-joining DNA ligase [Nocardioides alcanivorans]
MRPMLATRGDHVPTGSGWSHEVKWDGMRILADLAPTRAPRLFSRNENDVSPAWPELGGLPRRDLLLDGELVVLVDGRPDFGALANRMHARDPRRTARLAATTPATYLVFDLLRLDGRDLTGEPLEVRRRALSELDLADIHWQVPGTYDDGDLLWQATKDQGLEGIVSKRLSSRYEAGTRSRQWLKFPHRARTSWVVGGWRPEVGSAHRLAALLVGEPTRDGLLFRGRVGSGIAGKVGPQLLQLLTPLTCGQSPFVDEVPAIDAAGTRWVEPQVVIDVETLGIGAGGRLRQPSFRGVRSDLTPEDLTPEDLPADD